MAKKHSLIGGILKFILTLVLLVVFVFAVFYGILKFKYDIEAVSTIINLKKISNPVNEDELFTNKYSDEDMENVKTVVNLSLPGFITGNAEDGYDLSGAGLIGGATLLTGIELTDRQVAAYINEALESSENGSSVDVNGTKIDLSLVQITFSNLDANENTKVDFQVVIKLDMTEVKSQMTSFPTNLIKKYVPDSLYVASTGRIEKGTEKFTYSIISTDVFINTLTVDESEGLLNAADRLLGIGDSDKMAKMFLQPFLDALIGEDGFASTLKTHGANDYDFLLDDGVIYFAIVNE